MPNSYRRIISYVKRGCVFLLASVVCRSLCHQPNPANIPLYIIRYTYDTRPFVWKLVDKRSLKCQTWSSLYTHAHMPISIIFILYQSLANIFNDKSLTRRKWAKIYTGFIRNRLRSELDEIWCPCLLMRVYRKERQRVEQLKDAKKYVVGKWQDETKLKMGFRSNIYEIGTATKRAIKDKASDGLVGGGRECRFVGKRHE